MTSDEKNLARRFCNGEAGSFEALYDLYGARIYRFCYRLCRQAADAEDLTQEVFLAAWQGRERFERRASLTTWLYRIAVFQRRNLFPNRGPHFLSLNEREGQQANTALVPDPALAGLERLTLETALSALPDPLREAFLLVKGEGLRYREAADVLGLPEGTVKYHVHQAVTRLQSLLAPEPLPLSTETAPVRQDKPEKKHEAKREITREVKEALP